jgi:hypothetical protein
MARRLLVLIIVIGIIWSAFSLSIEQRNIEPIESGLVTALFIDEQTVNAVHCEYGSKLRHPAAHFACSHPVVTNARMILMVYEGLATGNPSGEAESPACRIEGFVTNSTAFPGFTNQGLADVAWDQESVKAFPGSTFPCTPIIFQSPLNIWQTFQCGEDPEQC